MLLGVYAQATETGKRAAALEPSDSLSRPGTRVTYWRGSDAANAAPSDRAAEQDFYGRAESRAESI